MALFSKTDMILNQKKIVFSGTHRICPPEVTLAQVLPIFSATGGTRVADLTGLDDIGIPVFQAVRPNAKTLSISQGKGTTSLLAKISAVMESIEMWHAEEMQLKITEQTVAEMRRELPYPLESLPLRDRAVLPERALLNWVESTVWGQEKSVWVPAMCVGMDATWPIPWPIFRTSSNGLASGNTPEEATAHGMCELLERDALARAGSSWHGRRLDLKHVDEPCDSLLERFAAAGVSVAVRDLGDLAHVPCFDAIIWSRSLPFCFTGSGCHPDAGVALSRALTEAAQSRLTLIAGTRDDIHDDIYRTISSRRDLRNPLDDIPSPTRTWSEVSKSSQLTASHFEDIEVLVAAVRRNALHAPLVVDLTRPELGIPVVRVLAPGLCLPRKH